jgi:dTDP-4-amino-4,6-dideoxygalactose transaminase
MSNIISRYQTAFADWFKVKNAFAFWKGRVAMYAILKALGVKDGDEVILPGYTCVAGVNPIKYLGAKPAYVDIEPNTFNMNPVLLESKITPKTKIIIAQHTYGYPCDMDAIMNIANKNGIVVVEDCCLALGSKYKDKIVGTFGKVAYFSSQWNKSFTTGLGGMAITSDVDLAAKIESLQANEMCSPSRGEVMMLRAQLAVYRLFIYPRTTTFAQSVFRYLTKKGVVVGSWTVGESTMTMADDFFKGMSIVQAWSGLRQLKKIERNIAHRKKIADLYDKLLEEKGWKSREYDRDVMDPVMVRYPVRIAQKDKALHEATKAGVELGSWFESPLHPIETPLETYDYKSGMCPEGEKAAREVVNLPLHPRVSEKMAERTVEFICNFHPAR